MSFFVILKGACALIAICRTVRPMPSYVIRTIIISSVSLFFSKRNQPRNLSRRTALTTNPSSSPGAINCSASLQSPSSHAAKSLFSAESMVLQCVVSEERSVAKWTNDDPFLFVASSPCDLHQNLLDWFRCLGKSTSEYGWVIYG